MSTQRETSNTEATAGESSASAAGLSADKALATLEDECWDLCCESGQIADTGDYDVWWCVYEHRMGFEKPILIGIGSSPIAAIFDATLPQDDPRRSDYIPPDEIEALARAVADNA